MTTQRLFVVRVMREGYVLAESPEAALRAGGEIEKWEVPTITAEAYPAASLHWPDHALVYGTKKDTTFKAAKAIHAKAAP